MDATYSTDLGSAYCADARDWLPTIADDSVDLVLTSPPFALRRKKSYGNVSEGDYVTWFLPFAREILRVLKPTGSFVFEIAAAWKRGTGTRSLMMYELVLELSKSFHLVQEFYWHNPSRLPSPAEYVSIRRNRVTDAVNPVWWFSKTTTPRADNRRVLREYGKSMRRLFREGVKATTRPSGHPISETFDRDNGGSIPTNLITAANTNSGDPYIRACREAGIVVHPARFPAAVPDFFVRFLTEPGDTVVDPFAGSNTTGHVAEKHGRKWLACEREAEYVRGSGLRFAPATPPVRGESAAV